MSWKSKVSLVAWWQLPVCLGFQQKILIILLMSRSIFSLNLVLGFDYMEPFKIISCKAYKLFVPLQLFPPFFFFFFIDPASDLQLRWCRVATYRKLRRKYLCFMPFYFLLWYQLHIDHFVYFSVQMTGEPWILKTIGTNRWYSRETIVASWHWLLCCMQGYKHVVHFPLVSFYL